MIVNNQPEGEKIPKCKLYIRFSIFRDISRYQSVYIPIIIIIIITIIIIIIRLLGLSEVVFCGRLLSRFRRDIRGDERKKEKSAFAATF